MRANKTQQQLCEVILSHQAFWQHSNDITSPTHLNDIDEVCDLWLRDLLSEDEITEFKNKLEDLYWFVRKFDSALTT